MYRKLLFVLALSCVPMLAVAQTEAAPSAPTSAIETFRKSVMSDAVLLELHLQHRYSTKQLDDATQGQADLKALVRPALDAAAGSASLVAAIKAFYVAAQTYFGSVFTPTSPPVYQPYGYSGPSHDQLELETRQAQLKSDLDSKNAALQLELQLASG